MCVCACMCLCMYVCVCVRYLSSTDTYLRFEYKWPIITLSFYHNICNIFITFSSLPEHTTLRSMSETLSVPDFHQGLMELCIINKPDIFDALSWFQTPKSVLIKPLPKLIQIMLFWV